MASVTDVLGIATLRCEGGTGDGGPPTFSSTILGFSTVATGGGAGVALPGGRSIFGGSFMAASIFGGSGSAGGGAGGAGIADGRGAIGRDVEGAPCGA